MSGLKSRNKGKRGEREAAKALNEILGTDTRRGRQFSGSPDSPDVGGIDGVHIEVKRDESTAGKRLYKAMEQSIDDCGNGSVPIVITRRNYEKWLLCLQLDDIIPFVKAVSKILDE